MESTKFVNISHIIDEMKCDHHIQWCTEYQRCNDKWGLCSGTQIKSKQSKWYGFLVDSHSPDMLLFRPAMELSNELVDVMYF